MSGLPDSFPLPLDQNLGIKIIGNGIPRDLVRNVFGPMFEGYKGPQFMPARDSGYMDAYANGDTEAEREIIHQTARDAGYNIFGYKAMMGDKPHMMGNVPEQEMTFMAQERRVAGMFTEGGQKPIREVATNASNLFDAANPEHFSKFEEWFRDFGLDRYNQEYFEVIEGGKESPHGRFIWDDLDSLLSFAKDKNYAILEMPSITRWMQESGYDGFYVREDGQGSSTPDNIAVFDPTKIKSIEPETTTISGQVIPPSKRFDVTQANINFMPSAKRGEEEFSPLTKKQIGMLQDHVMTNMSWDTAAMSKLADRALPEPMDLWRLGFQKHEDVKEGSIVELANESTGPSFSSFSENNLETDVEAQRAIWEPLGNESLEDLPITYKIKGATKGFRIPYDKIFEGMEDRSLVDQKEVLVSGKYKVDKITEQGDRTLVELSEVPKSTKTDATVYFMPAAKRGEDMETAYRNVTKRTPEVVDAVKKYQKGEIDQKDLFKVIRKYMPYRQMDEVPKPATREEMEMALNEDKVADIGKANENLKDGDLVGLRLDIPAYKDYGVWVASVHDAKEQKLGRIKGYESVAIANDVEFVTNPSVSMDIATGEKNKTSYARMVGKWEATTPEAARKEAEAAMSDPTYIQVGMNPFKNSWFYDRKTGNPVVNADRVIQIGGLVMAKNPVFTSPQDPRFMTKYGVQFMPKSEQPTVDNEGFTFPKNKSKPFKFTKQMMANFMPASGVNLEDHQDQPIIALPCDRMGIGELYVGPTGAKQELSVKGQGGPGFIYLQKTGIWAFTTEDTADRFMLRANQEMEKQGTDSLLVAPTLQSPINHLKNPTGQKGYVESMEAAVKAKILTKRDLDAQIKSISDAITKSTAASLSKPTKEKWANIQNWNSFKNAVYAKQLNFQDTAPYLVQLERKRHPVSAKELEKIGLLPKDIARDLADDRFFDLKFGSVVALFEVKKNAQPFASSFHDSYGWQVPGRPIGFLNNIYNVDELTSDPRIRNKAGVVQTQPLQTVLPLLDRVSDVLKDLKIEPVMINP
jgi:hypothetical protein